MRAMPYHCPYCADENLRPHGETHGEWECRSCLRAFRLGFIGQLAPADVTTHPTPSTTAPSTAAQSGRRTAS